MATLYENTSQLTDKTVKPQQAKIIYSGSRKSPRTCYAQSKVRTKTKSYYDFKCKCLWSLHLFVLYLTALAYSPCNNELDHSSLVPFSGHGPSEGFHGILVCLAQQGFSIHCYQLIIHPKSSILRRKQVKTTLL